MLDLVMIDGKARGIIARNLITGELERYFGHAVLLCTGGYGNVFYLSTNAMGSNATAAWKAPRNGAYFSNPCSTQIRSEERRLGKECVSTCRSRCSTNT